MDSSNSTEGRGGEVPSQQWFADKLRGILDESGVAAPGSACFSALSTHLHLLYRWNQQINLTGIRKFEEGIRRHAVESLEALPVLTNLLGEEEALLVDMGSGNGYPALPLLHTLPHLHGVLYESSGRKNDFLRSVIRSSRVGERVRTEHVRIKSPKELPAETAFVTLRAFPRPASWIPDLLEQMNLRGLLAWLSLTDAAAIAADIQGKGFRAEVLPLKSHATGALLLAGPR